MPALIMERPKMTRAVYESLKRHIMKEREKKKQEQEEDEMIERRKKERELRKKKELEDSQSLGETEKQISQLQARLDKLRHKKSELYNQLKEVLNRITSDDTRRKTQQKEQGELTVSASSAYHPPTIAPIAMHHGRPALYKPSAPPPPLTGMKRTRSPSPPPASSSYQQYGHSDAKYLHTAEGKYPGSHAAPPHPDAKFPGHSGDAKYSGHGEAKYLAGLHGSKHSLYPATPAAAAPPHPSSSGDFKGSSYGGSGGGGHGSHGSHGLYGGAGTAFQPPGASSSGGASYPTSQPSKYPSHAPAPGQSAFTSYQSHYSQHQGGPGGSKAGLSEPAFPAAAYPIQRMQQPGYHAGLQLQQPLDHQGSQKPSQPFDDKYKMGQTQIRGMVPSQQSSLMTQAIQIQQQQPKSSSSYGGPGYPSRSSAPLGASYPGPTPTTATSYSSQAGSQGRPAYQASSHPSSSTHRRYK